MSTEYILRTDVSTPKRMTLLFSFFTQDLDLIFRRTSFRIVLVRVQCGISVLYRVHSYGVFCGTLSFFRYNPEKCPPPLSNKKSPRKKPCSRPVCPTSTSDIIPCTHLPVKTGARPKFVGRAPERLAATGRPGAVLRLGFERRLSFPGGVRGEYYRGAPGVVLLFFSCVRLFVMTFLSR